MAPVEKLSPAYLNFCHRHPPLATAALLAFTADRQAAYLSFTQHDLPLFYDFLSVDDTGPAADACLVAIRDWSLTLLQLLSVADYLRLMQIWSSLITLLAPVLRLCPFLLKDLSHLLLRLPLASQQSDWLSLFGQHYPQLLLSAGLQAEQLRETSAPEFVSQIKALALFLAWQAGFAPGRLAALAAVDRLKSPLRDHLLAGYALSDWLTNPWLKARLDLKPHRQGQAFAPEDSLPKRGAPALPGSGFELVLVKTVGGLIGWSGRFYEPPQLAWLADGRLLLQDSQNAWLLTADAWGKHWQRVALQPLNPDSEPGDWQLSRSGCLRFQHWQADFPELKHWQQAVGNAQSLAISLPHSLRVYLIGLQPCA